MVYRKGERTAKHKAAEYLYQVPIFVPGLGLGMRLDRMAAWCQERGIAHDTFPERMGVSSVVVYGFKSEADAEAFAAAWYVQ